MAAFPEIVAALLPVGPVADALSRFCAIGIVLAAVNMNPLLELDGYFVSMDLLELPNLRARVRSPPWSRRRGLQLRPRPARRHST